MNYEDRQNILTSSVINQYIVFEDRNSLKCRYQYLNWYNDEIICNNCDKFMFEYEIENSIIDDINNIEVLVKQYMTVISTLAVLIMKNMRMIIQFVTYFDDIDIINVFIKYDKKCTK